MGACSGTPVADSEAVRAFARDAWSSSAEEGLQRLLATPSGVSAFRGFLALERREDYLALYADSADAMRDARALISPQARHEAMRLTPLTAEWDAMDGEERRALLGALHAATLRGLAVDCFPRFLLSPQYRELMDALQSEASTPTRAVPLLSTLSALENARRGLPRARRDDWLRWLCGVAHTLPLCVSITDMTRSGSPLLFVNERFEDATGYALHEIVGRNCRFLQGKERDQEGVRVAARAIAARRPFQVLLDNFRKDGGRFRNLLSCKPIFDGDAVVFYVGVQYVVTEHSVEALRLAQHRRMLDLLPSAVSFRKGAGK